MTRSIEVEINVDKELEMIENKIEKHSRIVKNLVWQRSELLIRKQDLEMCELIDCIVEKGLTANEALGIINSMSMQ